MKFPDLLYLQNCLFMSQIETNQRLANSFVDLWHCSDNHTYLTKSKAKGDLDIPSINTQIYGTQSVKYNCIKDWNNFRNNFSHICTYTLVKRKVKDYLIGKYWKYLLVLEEQISMICLSLLFCPLAFHCSYFISLTFLSTLLYNNFLKHWSLAHI